MQRRLRRAIVLGLAVAVFAIGCGSKGGSEAPGADPGIDAGDDVASEVEGDDGAGADTRDATGSEDAAIVDVPPVGDPGGEIAIADAPDPIDVAKDDVPPVDDVPGDEAGTQQDVPDEDATAADLPAPDTIGEVVLPESPACIGCHTNYTTLKALLPEDATEPEGGGG